MDVCVCRDTLDNLSDYLDDLKLHILHEIGKNYLDKKDYRHLIKWYTNDFLSDMIDIIKIDILYSICRNYCDNELTLDILIEDFV
tara:strand:- start:696 stop:950 length:255 start_codon:yes stop_codon:yes gene_type:complete